VGLTTECLCYVVINITAWTSAQKMECEGFNNEYNKQLV